MKHREPLSRREFMRVLGIASAGAFLASCATPEAEIVEKTVEVEKIVEKTVEVEVEKAVEVEKIVEVTPIPMTGPVNALGETLPGDALPLSEQFILTGIGAVGGGYGHIMESLYNRAFEHFGGQDPLTSLDINFDVYGVGCESWEPAADGSYWDFNLRKELVWSNGEPVTAHDWVYTLQWSLSNGYDFAWFYFDILNAQKVTSGELPPEELGIEAVDDFTLRIYTEAPVPYLPMLGVWFAVMPKDSQEALGENWALDPSRYVASGPFKLAKFDRALGNLWELNPEYQGIRRPWIERIREEPAPGGIAAYIEGTAQRLDIGANSPPAEIGLVNANPFLRAESHPQPSTYTDYLGFNTLGDFEPLADPNVRLALCKAIDKATIVSQIYQGFAHPAWGILPKGFPNYNPELENLDPNVYDVEAAQQLLADAGYPGGQGFPVYEMYIRQPTIQQEAVCQAIQAQWKDNLGITVELRPSDFQSFTSAAFGEKTAPMYYVGYAQDYNDPATFLNVFRQPGGRHPHDNPEWTEFYNEANSSFDPNVRLSGMKEAEIMLVESTAWFFVAQPFSIALWPCNAQGPTLEPNRDGFRMWGGGAIGCPHAYEGMYWADSDCRAGLG